MSIAVSTEAEKMLAFNLGVFFRNLKGEEVTFRGANPHCEVRFTGGVQTLHEHTDLTRHLAVTLTKGDLSCRIAFEDQEEAHPEDAEVEVRLVQQTDPGETLLLQTSFFFRDISLKPVSEEEGDAPPGPKAG